jgi:hypothetical protein
VESALPLWESLANDQRPVAVAAGAVCQTAMGGVVILSHAGQPAAVTQEFVRWYRRLLEHGAEGVVRRIHAGADNLAGALPDVARVLQSVSAESPETVAA